MLFLDNILHKEVVHQREHLYYPNNNKILTLFYHFPRIFLRFLYLDLVHKFVLDFQFAFLEKSVKSTKVKVEQKSNLVNESQKR